MAEYVPGVNYPKRVMIGDLIYTVQGVYPHKGDASARARITRKTRLFKSVRIIKRKEGWVLCVRGVKRNPDGLTAQQLMRETGAPRQARYDKKTGRLLNW